MKSLTRSWSWNSVVAYRRVRHRRRLLPVRLSSRQRRDGRFEMGSIPAGFEPGARPVGMAFSGFCAMHEGMRLLGRPMGDAVGNGQGDIAVQDFENGRLENHPEKPSPEWQFLPGLLASELIDLRVELPVGGDASSMTNADLARLRGCGTSHSTAGWVRGRLCSARRWQCVRAVRRVARAGARTGRAPGVLGVP